MLYESGNKWTRRPATEGNANHFGNLEESDFLPVLLTLERAGRQLTKSGRQKLTKCLELTLLQRTIVNGNSCIVNLQERWISPIHRQSQKTECCDPERGTIFLV